MYISLIAFLIGILYLAYFNTSCIRSRAVQPSYLVGEHSTALNADKTLNDLDMACQTKREPVYDDTSRIDNSIYWMSEYSHPQYDTGKNLNDDVLTPIRPVSGSDDISRFSNMHNVTRFGCERS